ncbi:Phosphate-binding protein PstS [Rhodocyclaceae bacterium]|nr:Phosphate-binding protein PstS [Rhodocyclaceae bacterium]
MMKAMLSPVWSVFLMMLSCIFVANAGAAESLVLAGSGSNLSAIKLLIKGFTRVHPEIKIAEPTNIGSSGAIRAAFDGAVSLGLVSRPLRTDEKGLGLAYTPFARTALVIGAHSGVADEGISYDDLISIYRGTKTTWKNGRTIIVLTREPGDSTIDVLEQKVPGFKAVFDDSIKANRWSVLLKDEVMNQKLIATADAIGFSDMGAITSQKLNIKVLKVNGIYPSAQNVTSGAYPLFKTLSFLYRSEKITPAMKTFMAFARSAEGKKILSKNGYVPSQ